ncbi:translation initiation factor eIF4E [Nowakowskiella sp. JEL0078]|nr:translation initiation factor eIF4E [Nowakowskiella sp. JEL0078]
MIDDTVGKLSSQPNNHVLIPTYDVSDPNCSNDTSLLSVIKYLETILENSHNDVRDFIKIMPFCKEENSIVKIHHQFILTEDLDLNGCINITKSKFRPVSSRAIRTSETGIVLDDFQTHGSVNLKIDDSKSNPRNTEKITVFKDATKFNVKHPLQNKWTIWFDNPGRKNTNNWASSLKKIYTFDSVNIYIYTIFGKVEDFWGTYNNIKPVSQLPSGSSYYLFKFGIQPMWEDPVNAKGGKWVFQNPCILRESHLDSYWLEAVMSRINNQNSLACIGEYFTSVNEICGIVVSLRKIGDRVALWTRNSQSESITKMIGVQLKSFLGIIDDAYIGYKLHTEVNGKEDLYSV